MLIKQTFLFCGCNRFDFESDGNRIKMCKLDLVSLDARQAPDAYGHEVITLSAPYDFFDELVKVNPLTKVDLEVEVLFGKKNTKREIVGFAK